ncbi:CinA family nicotinamide mononucleotide deamidase-related protein [Chitinophaga sp. XS-30]|uniref:CinA family nicotinamide mononucleotide deamidase-related protein n=1 Tax=Chitinophaga sp. XS-30 TaxID=2604421 RepID=UPI0011DDA629|nr:CinA family nicotinamide mononucleotide deamidase-related protein [Chitinophaga sp. XS-30]QEH41299.1 CinA family nicotinamide mononucleotide deamidase-related protein [Chitinophaga sp. XS-30]
MEKILASIITIGDELLIGQTVDTNSAWMARELNQAGIWVQRRVAVGDDRSAIIQALEEEGRQSHIVLITGGLGPTADDITKPVLCEYFGGKLVRDEATYAAVMQMFESRGLPVLQRNVDQALVPDVCTVLPNRRGTAPGMWFGKDEKIYVSMPGVPFEMKGLMEEEVIPRLRERFETPALLHHTLITTGMGESFVAERLSGFEALLPPHIKLAYLPSFGLLKLRLTTVAPDKISAAAELSAEFTKMRDLLTDILVAETDQPMSAILAEKLMTKGLTVGTAESCTGGSIASQITALAGSSQYFSGSVVSYSNEVKMNVLGVQPATLERYGAVSEETVLEMAAGALKVLKTDCVMAVSGIMGPGGGSEEKPVGTVWIAAGGPGSLRAKKYHFRYDRARNIAMTCVAAQNELRKWLERSE